MEEHSDKSNHHKHDSGFFVQKETLIKQIHSRNACPSDQIMDSALRDGWISINPAKDHRIFNPSPKQPILRNALSLDILREIISSLWGLGRHDRLYLSLIIFTGMRRGEVLALRWEDIDFEENVINVQRNVTYTNNQPFIGSPKTNSGYRAVPILNELLSFLSPYEESGFIVFGADSESPMTL